MPSPQVLSPTSVEYEACTALVTHAAARFPYMRVVRLFNDQAYSQFCALSGPAGLWSSTVRVLFYADTPANLVQVARGGFGARKSAHRYAQPALYNCVEQICRETLFKYLGFVWGLVPGGTPKVRCLPGTHEVKMEPRS